MMVMNLNIMKSCDNKILYSVFMPALTMILLFAANLFYGSVDIPADAVIDILAGDASQHKSWQLIVLQSRLPQAVVALFCGMSLSVSGLMLQTLFNNPLAGPEVFGINSGAGLGVAIVMLLLQGSFTAGNMSIGGYLALLAGAFVGSIVIIIIILLFSVMLKNAVFLLIAGMS